MTELDIVCTDINNAAVNNAAINNAHAVEVLLTSLQAQDTDGVGAVLDDNLVYQNVGFPTIRGRARAMKLFRAMEGRLGFEVKIHRIAVNGSTVLTERTDVLAFGPVRVQFWVCGTFEVHDGRITLWRDYFDMFDMTKALVRGILGAAIPALRPTL
jgi:limonene-1,2-epoxide hydrolase